MEYKPVQKKNSSWTPAKVQKKGKSPGKLGHFSIQPKPNQTSAPPQEIGDYSRASADRLAANVMRGLQAKEQEQAEGSTVQRKSESPWTARFDVAPPTTQTPTPQMGTAFAPVSENPIQRQCADCAKEEEEQAGEAGKDLEEIGIQTKLTIGAPGDAYEQEADRVASQVMSMSAPPDSSASVQRRLDTNNPNQIWQRAQSITPVVQRRIDPPVQMGQMVQRAAQIDGNQASGDLESRLNASKGGGSPLSEDVRGFMEPRFGADFSGVRVHTGGEAVQMNQELGAQAFTHGSDVYFGALKSPGNNELTAHELAHVEQQNSDSRAVQRLPSSNPKTLPVPTNSLSMSQLASSKAAAFSHLHGRPSSTPGAIIQRRRSNGVSVSRMKFSPSEIPADSKTTSQATVNYSGRIAGGAKIRWTIDGPAFGTKVDANGLITPGAAIKKGADKVRVKVKAEDSKYAGAHTYGYITLWDAEYLQAKTDYPKFRGKTFKKDPFIINRNGKFALAYRPRSHRLDATIRVSFTFKNNVVGAAKWNKHTKRAFERTFIRVVQNRWSNQYKFVNVREPQSIWKKLNPVRVRVKVKQDNKNPHFNITVNKNHPVGVTSAVGVGGNQSGKARFEASDTRPQPAFNPATGKAELAALANVTPTPIQFAAGSSAIKAADKGKVEFMATYLRRIKNPRFKLIITGHHQQVVHAPKATKAQKRATEQQATRLSKQRANEVFKILREGRATYHQIRKQGVGDAGAAATPAWDKAEIAAALPKGWQNVQTTLEHEAGHMLGLGDEYISGGAPVGTKTTHYALTMQAFGKQYADVQATIVADSASLMNGGNDIRPHHYVTLWDGLAQLTQAAAVPKVPFKHADWQFQGEG
ncbi:eCIS core domain-containing protein [Coleofasciculus sp.]|uniref:eCIS core domain-containing protein n=1 Tax=Coleofasciculus sp. TaxID=3100458 RepID=UPI0039FAB21C